MNEQIEGAIKHVRAYWFVDGFIEMAAGALFVLLGALLLFGGLISPAALSSKFLTVTGEVAAAKVVGLLAAGLILWWLKDHFTYPRTGFVRNARLTGEQVSVLIRNILLFLMVPVLALLAVSLLLTSSGSMLAAMPVWFPLGVAIVWAILLAAFAGWTGVGRFRLLAALTLVAGILIAGWQLATGLPQLPATVQPGTWTPEVLESISRSLAGLAVLLITCSAVLLVSGLVTFLRYRKENPVPYGEGA